jgi:predicted ribosome quality control (RQC) complex YloA/Tae2 family protein
MLFIVLTFKYIMIIENYTFNNVEYSIIIGENKYENFKIIDESISTDIWFHVDGEPSCHVILKNSLKLREIPKQVIKRCAYLCKINSKAKTQKKTTIIYTLMENVTQTNIIGQVITREHKTTTV